MLKKLKPTKWRGPVLFLCVCLLAQLVVQYRFSSANTTDGTVPQNKIVFVEGGEKKLAYKGTQEADFEGRGATYPFENLSTGFSIEKSETNPSDSSVKIFVDLSLNEDYLEEIFFLKSDTENMDALSQPEKSEIEENSTIVSPSETEEEIWVSPTEDPTSISPTEEPISISPTEEPISVSPTEEPISVSPTEEPISVSPTEEPISVSPTEEPISVSPTEEPISVSPTEEAQASSDLLINFNHAVPLGAPKGELIEGDGKIDTETITFQYTVLAPYVSQSDISSEPRILMAENINEKIGSYTWTWEKVVDEKGEPIAKISDDAVWYGKIELDCTIDLAYITEQKYGGIAAKADLSYDIGSELIPGGDPTIEYDNIKEELIVKFPEKKPPTVPTPTPTPVPGYNLEKKVVTGKGLENTFPNTTFQITATATNGGYLNQATLYDQMPKGLLIENVSAKLTYISGSNKVIETIESISASDAQGKGNWKVSGDPDVGDLEFGYILPEKLENGNITEAVLTITAKLTEKEYFEILNSNKARDYKNTVSLSREQDDEDGIGKIDPIEKEAIDKLGQILTKGQVGSDTYNARRINWEATIKVSGTSIKNLYLIDWIETTDKNGKNQHDFVKSSIKRDGKSLKCKDLGDYSYLPTVSAANLNFETIDKLIVSAAAEGKLSPGDAFVYKRGTENVLIVPISLSEEPILQRKEVKVTYTTEIEKGFEGNKGSFYNSAKLVWGSAQYGDGTEQGQGGSDGSVDLGVIGKDVTVEFPLIKKIAVPNSYTRETQELKWKIEVNSYATSLENVVVEDVFDSNIMELISPNPENPQPISLEIYEFPSDVEEGAKAAAMLASADAEDFDKKTAVYWDGDETNIPKGNVYYTIKENEEGNTVLQLHFKKLKDFYRFEITTKVVDGKLLKQAPYNGYETGSIVEGKVPNRVTISADKLPSNVPSSSDAEHTITNQWLIKAKDKAGSPYNYETKSINWKVIANMNYLPMRGYASSSAILKDDMPAGTVFGKITEDGTYIESYTNGVKEKFTVQSVNYAEDNQSGTIAFINHVTIPFKVSKASQGDYSKDSISFELTEPGEISKYKFVLEYTTVLEEKFLLDKFRADSNKAETLKNEAYLYGEYVHNGTGYRIVQNNSTNPAYDYEEQNVKYSSLTKTGKYKEPAGDLPVITWTVELNRLQANFGGVTLKDELQPHMDLNTDSLKIYKAKMDSKGNFTVSGEPDERLVEKFVEFLADGFDFTIPDEDGYRNSGYILVFDTTITETATADQMTNSIKIYGEKIKEDGVADKKVANAKNFNYSDWAKGMKTPELEVVKKSSTNKYGPIPLKGVEFSITAVSQGDSGWIPSTGRNVYQKTRKTATDGKLTFLRLRPDVVYEIKEKEAPGGYRISGSDVQYVVFTAKDAEMISVPEGTMIVSYDAAKKNLATLTIENEPTGKFSFTKRNESEIALQNIEFELYKGRNLIDKKSTDMNGKIEFTSLDPDTYKLVEVSKIPGYRSAGPWNVTVASDGNITIKAVNSEEKKTVSGDAIYNYYKEKQLGSIQLTKVDAANPAMKLSGAEFALYNEDGDVVQKVSTSDEGLVYFTQIEEGKYYLQETQAPEGYVLKDEKIPVTISISGDDTEMIKITFENSKPTPIITGGVTPTATPTPTDAPTSTPDVPTSTPQPTDYVYVRKPSPTPTSAAALTQTPTPTKKPKKVSEEENIVIGIPEGIPEGDISGVVDPPKNGEVIFEDGIFTYIPEGGFDGEDSFIVEVKTPEGDVEDVVIDVSVPAGSFSLPQTGLPSATPYYVVGAILLLGGGFLVLKKKRKS